jgi:hypothetical protein
MQAKRVLCPVLAVGLCRGDFTCAVCCNAMTVTVPVLKSVARKRIVETVID